MPACYGEPQYSTMRQTQWADRQAPDLCPITVFIAPNNGCFHRKTLKQHIYRTALKCALKFPPNFDPTDFGSRNDFVNKKLLSSIVPPNVDLIPSAVQYVTTVKYVSAKVIIIQSRLSVSTIAIHIVETTSHIHNGHDIDKDNDN